MFKFIKQAFSGKKLVVRVPHAKGLHLTDRNQFGEDAERLAREGAEAGSILMHWAG